MAFEIVPDELHGVVRVTVRGIHDARQMEEIVTLARTRSQELKRNILYDLREAAPGTIGAADLYWLARRLPAMTGPGATRTRVAVVHPPQFVELAAFWETTFRNAGLKARAFVEEADALVWLRE